jgi:23S rRNA pseudouridine2605 synthase
MNPALEKTMPLERLQKVMAHAGVASRRASEKIIEQGRVTVNGQVVAELGAKIDPARDTIAIDGKILAKQAERWTCSAPPKTSIEAAKP